MENCLRDQKQRVKINSSFSNWRNILYVIPEDSLSGFFLFNMFVNELFLFLHNIDISSYAHDNTPYTVSKSTTTIVIIF